jgi:hypothetical protein
MPEKQMQWRRTERRRKWLRSKSGSANKTGRGWKGGRSG